MKLQLDIQVAYENLKEILKDTVEKVSKEIEVKTKQRDELSVETERLETYLVSLNTLNQEQKDRVDGLEAEYKFLEEKKSVLVKEVEVLDAKRRELLDETVELGKKITVLKTEQTEYQLQLKKRSDTLDVKEENLKVLLEDYDMRNAILNKREERIINLEKAK